MKERVIIALSGGVDSSVSAYLLKQQNYEVIAIFMQNWDDYINNYQTSFCNQFNDWKDAKKVAEQLDIKIYKVDFIIEYWEKIFKVFLKGLKKGITPNPDILCNSIIKFHYFIKYVQKKFNAKFIATGHYAKIIKKNNNYYLAKPKDTKKDQTYFLCQINKNIFNKIIFPLNNLNKKEVRKIALANQLITANKKDSVGLCFIGNYKFNNFLINYINIKKGLIIDFDSKKVLGEHKGIHLYTIGQRRQLNLSGFKKPYYVVNKQIKKNIIYVSQNLKNKYLYSNFCKITNFNILLDDKELTKINKNKITAKFRYLQKEVNIQILKNNNWSNLEIKLDKPQWAITPGQYAVFYINKICLGGGIIKSTKKIN